jgi:hypothetical protein
MMRSTGQFFSCGYLHDVRAAAPPGDHSLRIKTLSGLAYSRSIDRSLLGEYVARGPVHYEGAKSEPDDDEALGEPIEGDAGHAPVSGGEAQDV